MVFFLSAAILGLPFWILLWLFGKFIKFKVSIQYYCFSFVGLVLFILLFYLVVKWHDESTYFVNNSSFGEGDMGWGWVYYFFSFLPLIIPVISIPHVTLKYLLSKTGHKTGFLDFLIRIFILVVAIGIIVLVLSW